MRWSVDDSLFVFYLFSQALLLPVVIAYLSLRIRRGALPAGIAIIAVLNVFTVVISIFVESSSGAQAVALFVAFLSLIGAIATAGLIHDEIPRAAADD